MSRPATPKAQIPRVEARCERGRVTQTQAAQPGADFHSAPRRRPVQKPGFRGKVSAKQVGNTSRFRPPDADAGLSALFRPAVATHRGPLSLRLIRCLLAD